MMRWNVVRRSSWCAQAASILIFSLMALAPAAPARAGQTCQQHPLTTAQLEKGLALAQRTKQQLDSTGAGVVLLARTGHNLSEYGLHYSHVGWAYKKDGKWLVVQKLNQCGTAVSSLYIQGLGEFFLDDMYLYDAGYVIPAPEVQQQLIALIEQKDRVKRMHTRAYNMLSYPWATRYQQSNQWALETFALAMDPQVSSRESAQAWLRLKGYTPTTLKIGALKRLGARVTRANIVFDDQPIDNRIANHIETVTVDSIFGWMQDGKLSGSVQTVH
jgi:hypothetical protein